MNHGRIEDTVLTVEWFKTMRVEGRPLFGQFLADEADRILNSIDLICYNRSYCGKSEAGIAASRIGNNGDRGHAGSIAWKN